MEEKEIKALQRSISKLTGGDLADALGVLAAEKADIEDREKIHKAEVLKPQFYELLRGRRAPAYVAFDLPWLDGADLRPLPLSERRRRLQGILPEGSPVISEAVSVEGRGANSSS